MIPRAKPIGLGLMLGLVTMYCEAHGLAASGWLHPLTGPDHMLAMVAVGAWSTQLGGLAVLLVPAAFLGAMAMGAWAGFADIGNAAALSNVGVAMSVLFIGTAIATQHRTAVVAAALAVGLFGLCHGYAHGLEMPRAAEPGWYATGFLATTAALHICGAAGGLLLTDSTGGGRLLKIAGASTALIGVGLCCQLLM